MSKLPTLSREHRIYLALWRKGYQAKLAEAEPIVVNASSYSAALAIRSGMYKAIRPYREGRAFDAELTEAAQHCVVTAMKPLPGEQAQVLIRPRASLVVLESELEALGITEADIAGTVETVPLPPVELQDPGLMPSGRKTPFYTRED
jgi:hypothetical protein